ncbi:MAG: pyridoxal phosphate-dependent aminotransferase [Duncaniella sp.]|uniref:pyridoxal phosphate-dependent aminotransferase n=1 Tax=Duncaniella muricolitica TaxID=2880704 RepID=UPI00244E52ED|nr:pyridoxal phosphate-dependent aminotransferase [Duncaniella muricolitica]MCX4368534.1 pyridoxal phosphate-dependent aminotransferase [Duncaniella sp.]
MSTHVSERVQSLAPSATLAMSQKSNELKAQGVDVINLSVGEPDFETPAHIKEAAKKAIDDNFTFYTPVPGYMSLRRAISDKLRNENGVDYAPEQITVSNGAKQALCNVILASINKGDEVIIPMPAWVSYVEMVKLAEGTPVAVNADISQDFKITPAQLEAAITPATRMILICSPSNPTGSVYTREELQGLVDVLAKHPEIIVLADEIYEHINFTGSFTSLASFPEIADRTVIINGVSKAYAMTGWRIGYSASPLWLAKAVNKLQGQYTSNASSIAQKAAEAAYTGSQECVREMNKAFERRRDLVVELASQIPGLKVNRPTGAFYLFPEVSAYVGTTTPEGNVIASSADLAMYLLEKGHVATVDGGAFGMEGYIRLSYATSDDNIREAMRRIAETLATLKK